MTRKAFRLQFSLKLLMVLVAACALLFALVSWPLRLVAREQAAAMRARQLAEEHERAARQAVDSELPQVKGPR